MRDHAPKYESEIRSDLIATLDVAMQQVRQLSNSRAVSLAKTKLEEAMLWLESEGGFVREIDVLRADGAETITETDNPYDAEPVGPYADRYLRERALEMAISAAANDTDIAIIAFAQQIESYLKGGAA